MTPWIGAPLFSDKPFDLLSDPTFLTTNSARTPHNQICCGSFPVTSTFTRPCKGAVTPSKALVAWDTRSDGGWILGDSSHQQSCFWEGLIQQRNQQPRTNNRKVIQKRHESSAEKESHFHLLEASWTPKNSARTHSLSPLRTMQNGRVSCCRPGWCSENPHADLRALVWRMVSMISMSGSRKVRPFGCGCCFMNPLTIVIYIMLLGGSSLLVSRL